MTISEAAKKIISYSGGDSWQGKAEEYIRQAIDAETAVKDAEIARLTKIVSDCLAAMPFGNIATHTPANLPARITDLAAELARGEILNDELVEALKELAYRTKLLIDDMDAKGKPGWRASATFGFFGAMNAANAALKKVGAE